MIEKLLENWLTESTERSWQRPFCAMLVARGHRIIHSTRHNEFELGVDVISINPANETCAFQLKSAPGERLTLGQWNEISAQVDELVCGQISHPSLPAEASHRSFLVVDAFLEESVSRAIENRNNQWISQGQKYRKIETILYGDLQQWSLELGESLWPSELKDTQLLLELFLQDGRGQFPCSMLWELLESTCPLSPTLDKSPSFNSCARSVSAAMLLTGIAISKFSHCKNYVAEIEAWSLCLSAILGTCDRWEVDRRKLSNSLELVDQIIQGLLFQLTEEVRERTNLLEGDAQFDSPFQLLQVRKTQLSAFLSIFALWRRVDNVPAASVDDFLERFVKENQGENILWGEAAVPQHLATMFFLEKIETPIKSDAFLLRLLSSVVQSKKHGAGNPLPSPYYSIEEVLPHAWGRVGKVIDYDSFVGKSYSLEGLVHLVARRCWKNHLKLLWYDIAAIFRCEFKLNEKWHFYRWRNPEGGTNSTRVPSCPERWEDLLKAARDDSGDLLPDQVKVNPIHLLLILCVAPHRANSDALRWLDSKF